MYIDKRAGHLPHRCKISRGCVGYSVQLRDRETSIIIFPLTNEIRRNVSAQIDEHGIKLSSRSPRICRRSIRGSVSTHGGRVEGGGVVRWAAPTHPLASISRRMIPKLDSSAVFRGHASGNTNALNRIGTTRRSIRLRSTYYG